ncbi:MAG TPA: T9SS type A sorting domain-containing protein [Ignavibacteria bacterium]|nr:T9SS type A sorting domain-containing protein [Ignavibacteria bacterium]
MIKKFLLVFISLFLSGTSSAQISKAYVLCEGGFSSNSSRLGMYNILQNNYNGNIFTPGNLGLYPDGLIYHQNYLYLLEQGGFGGEGKIHKLDTNGTVVMSRSFGVNPYSLAISNGKIYTTNGSSRKVIVLDLNSFNTVKEITVGVYPQEIVSVGNRVIVANNSLFGGDQDSSISVIDCQNDSAISRVFFRTEVSSLAISNDGKVFIGCSGDKGRIYKFDPVSLQRLDSFQLSSGFEDDLTADRNSNDVYYINYFNGISKLNLISKQVTDIINNPDPANVYFYGYNYDYSMNKHYVADAKSFVVNGALRIYNSAGVQENSFATGIAPRRIVFNVPSGVGIQSISEFAEGYELNQNYPNPFNPVTKINFSLPKSEFVRLSVYNLNGREVAELVNRNLKSGSYEFEFDAKNLSSGVYVYKIVTAGFSATKKMILLK